MVKKVLIAEDDIDLRSLLKKYLEKCNLEVLEASDGNEAVSFAKEKKPDMVITDNNMPGLTGYEVLQSLKNDDETKNIPVVMVAGKNFEQERKMLLKFGAAECIQKPYQEDKIVEVIEKILGGIKTEGTSGFNQKNIQILEDKKETESKQDVSKQFGEEQQVVGDLQTDYSSKIKEAEQPILTGTVEEKQGLLEPITTEKETLEIFAEAEKEKSFISEKIVDGVNEIDDLQRFENVEVKQDSEVSELVKDLSQGKVENVIENSSQQSFEEQVKIEEKSVDVLEEKIVEEKDFSKQDLKGQEISTQREVIESQKTIEEQQIHQQVLQNSNEIETPIPNLQKEEVVDRVEATEEKQVSKEGDFKDTELQDKKETEEVLSKFDKQKVFKSKEPIEKVSIRKTNSNLSSTNKEKLIKTEKKESVIDEEIYLVSKLVSTSVLETLFPQKKVKPTPDSKAIVLIVEDMVSKETLSKLNQIIEIIPLMKVMVNKEIFGEKKEKIKKHLKVISKEDILDLSEALLKFFKK